MHTEDDLTLVRLAQGGARRALDALLRRHHDTLYALCRRMTRNDADAQDATQDAMIAIVRGLDRFDGRAAFTTWAYRITANACIDELRRRRRRPDPGLPEHEVEPRGAAPGIDETVADRHDLDAALAGVPEDFRAALVLRDVLGLDYAEIGEVLDIPPGTVRSRIARGRAAMAKQLHATDPGSDGNQGLPGDVPTRSDGHPA